MSKSRVEATPRARAVTNIVIAAALLGVLLYTILTATVWSDGAMVYEDGEPTIPIFNIPVQVVGDLLYSDWGIVIIILGLALVSAMLGGVFIAQEEDEE